MSGERARAPEEVRLSDEQITAEELPDFLREHG